MQSKRIIVSVSWQYAERIISQGVNFIVTIILARLLTPKEFGVVATALLSISILEIFVTCGLGNALIQKKNIQLIDYSSVLIFNVIISILIYIILYFSASQIGIFFGNPDLEVIIRLLSLKIIFSSFNSIQYAYMQRNMQFKTIFKTSSISSTLSAIAGVTLAFCGLGVYSLIIQYLLYNIINTIYLSIIIKWKPKIYFSKKSLIPLITYGWKILVSGIINTIFNELKGIIISKQYSPTQLAYYDRGKQFPSLVYENINTSVGKVLFPILSIYQDDKIKTIMIVRKSLRILTYLSFPILTFLFALSDNIIEIILTNKWRASAPFMSIACITYYFVIFNTVFTNAINSKGKSDIHLKIEVITTMIGIIILLISMNFGIIYIALSVSISTIFSATIRYIIVNKILEYNLKMIISDIIYPVIFSIFLYIFIFIVKHITSSALTSVIILGIICPIIYITLSITIHPQNYIELKLILKSIKSNKND